MRYVKWLFGVLILMGLITLLFYHRHSTKQNNFQIMTATTHSLNKDLFFAGTLQPLKTIVVTSPADGVIEDMTFHYGDVVASNQLLFQVLSEKFQSDYKTALTQYIKAKTDYTTNESQLKEATFLYKNQLISRDSFHDKKISYYNAQFSFIQAKETLSHILQRLDLHGLNPYTLKISDIDKISAALRLQDGAKHLQVKAPVAGVILLPNKEDNSADALKNIAKGTQIKQGDILAVVSDLSSLIVHIAVSEFNINQLHEGQLVTVTGAAFPEYTLTGKIIGMNKQGQPNQNGLPSFPVDIAIDHLTTEQKKIIHIGMSAQVAIHMTTEAVISVPIKAVLQKDGQTYVRIQDHTTKKIKEVAVKTGATTLDSVMIESHLSDGENIVIPD